MDKTIRMKRKVIEIVNGVTRHPLYRMADPLNFTLCEGEQLAIVGLLAYFESG